MCEARDNYELPAQLCGVGAGAVDDFDVADDCDVAVYCCVDHDDLAVGGDLAVGDDHAVGAGAAGERDLLRTRYV